MVMAILKSGFWYDRINPFGLIYGLNFTNYSSAGLTVICKMK